MLLLLGLRRRGAQPCSLSPPVLHSRLLLLLRLLRSKLWPLLLLLLHGLEPLSPGPRLLLGLLLHG